MEMRRKDRQMSEDLSLELLAKGEFATLATASADNMPYAVPISYVLSGNIIYIHCAPTGHKLENINANENVCLNVVGKTKPYATENNYSSYYESVTVFGKANVVKDEKTCKDALKLLVEKYFPNNLDNVDRNVERALSATTVVAIEIEKITGKSNLEK